MDNKWVKAGNIYRIRDIGSQVDKIEPGVYKLGADMMGFYLEYQYKQFKFPYKVYGMDSSFVGRVCKTFKHVNDNLGVLLNGIKGSGKTVVSKRICNQLELPVIIIADKYEGINHFINEFQQEAVFLFDEYEKIFKDGYEMLTVMDGVMNTPYKKVFILTTNDTWVNSNMLQRPGRIRYFKSFGQLGVEAIEEIVDDKLDNKAFKGDIMKFISQLETITVDIVKCIVDECNIHGETPDKFADVFNVKKSDDEVDIYSISAEGKKLVYREVQVVPKKLDANKHINVPFRVNGSTIGFIKQVNGDGTFVIEEVVCDEDGDEIIDDKTGVPKKQFVTYKIENCNTVHPAFYGYNY